MVALCPKETRGDVAEKLLLKWSNQALEVVRHVDGEVKVRGWLASAPKLLL